MVDFAPSFGGFIGLVAKCHQQVDLAWSNLGQVIDIPEIDHPPGIVQDSRVHTLKQGPNAAEIHERVDDDHLALHDDLFGFLFNLDLNNLEQLGVLWMNPDENIHNFVNDFGTLELLKKGNIDNDVQGVPDKYLLFWAS